jgi:hypothetical protein
MGHGSGDSGDLIVEPLPTPTGSVRKALVSRFSFSAHRRSTLACNPGSACVADQPQPTLFSRPYIPR